MQTPSIYLDNNATTQIAPEVIEAMLPMLTTHWANPSSPHSFGQRAASFIDKARAQVAALINADPRETIFTSCATESNNAAINSALLAMPGKKHIITTAVEHASILNFCEALQKRGYQVTYLPVDNSGLLNPADLEMAIRPDTAIVSTMMANNETGVIFPLHEIAAICRRKSVLLHTDAVQAAGKIPIDVKALGVDFLSLSGHKLHAPKGIGALYVKRQIKYHPLVLGGHQERGRRGGTENTANIVAFGQAAESAVEDLRKATTIAALRDTIEETVLAEIPDTIQNGTKTSRLPNTTNLTFTGVSAESIIAELDNLGIYVSSGSACNAGAIEPSHVLSAMGIGADQARSSLRFSLSKFTTPSDVDFLLEKVPLVISNLRTPTINRQLAKAAHDPRLEELFGPGEPIWTDLQAVLGLYRD